MVLREFLPPHAPPPDILAVDVNPVALHRARESHYGPWAVRETPQIALERWFTPDGRGLRLADEIRELVRFERCNLADPDAEIWSPACYDVIFCRNVIMYFTPAMQRTVVARLVRSLAPGGYLFLGHAETLRGLTDDLRLIHSHGTFYYQRPSGTPGDAVMDRATPTVPAPWMSTTPDIGWDAAISIASTRIQSLAQRHRPQPVPSSPTRPEALPAGRDLAEALRLVQIGRTAAAAEICAQLLDVDALNAGAAYVLGLCLEASGDTARARDQYDVAIQLDPRFAMPRFRRGLLDRRAGSPSADIELATAASLLDVEDTARLLLFGGGFGRSALIEMCRPQSCDLARRAS
jgi:chemotaxis protein methyltransferase CheR